jgi:hypothetical protein
MLDSWYQVFGYLGVCDRGCFVVISVLDVVYYLRCIWYK